MFRNLTLATCALAFVLSAMTSSAYAAPVTSNDPLMADVSIGGPKPAPTKPKVSPADRKKAAHAKRDAAKKARQAKKDARKKAQDAKKTPRK